MRMLSEPITNPQLHREREAALTDHDLAIIASVERALADGLVLKNWWERVYPANGFRERFELERVFNRPDNSFGFFDQVEFKQGSLPVMGNFQDMFYDQPRTPINLNRRAAEWMGNQIREFALRYFMRVSAFRQPEVYVESKQSLSSYLERLSWCTQPGILRQGFGFKQHYYKLRGSGQIGKFSEREETAIVDLREIGEKYEWLVVQVRIFDFNLRFRPFGVDGPELSLPLTEQSYLVLSRDFILNEDNPSPNGLGRSGLGYAFIRDPTQGLIAYGPGQFRAAIEIINFEVSTQGQIRVSMIFVADRPERIANVSLNPVDWSFRVADLFSLGMTSKFLAPIKNSLEQIPTSVDSFDPVYTFISLANGLTANQAGQQLCISREQLEKDFLAQHFMQHYETIVGSLLTWRQIPDWTDRDALPEWVVTGKSS